MQVQETGFDGLGFFPRPLLLIFYEGPGNKHLKCNVLSTGKVPTVSMKSYRRYLLKVKMPYNLCPLLIYDA